MNLLGIKMFSKNLLEKQVQEGLRENIQT